MSSAERIVGGAVLTLWSAVPLCCVAVSFGSGSEAESMAFVGAGIVAAASLPVAFFAAVAGWSRWWFALAAVTLLAACVRLVV